MTIRIKCKCGSIVSASVIDECNYPSKEFRKKMNSTNNSVDIVTSEIETVVSKCKCNEKNKNKNGK